MGQPHIILDSTTPAKEFTGKSGDLKRIATSGVTDGATPRLQHRVGPNDAWVDHPDYTPAADQHISGLLTITAPYNRVFIDGATGNTAVNLVL